MIESAMGTLALVALLGGEPALVQANWTVDGIDQGQRHTLTVKKSTGRYKVCASRYRQKPRCKTADVVAGKVTTVAVGLD